MKLLVLSASTGGGHDMRAYALQDWWQDQGGECKVDHPLENSFWGYKAGCQLYNIIQKKMPLLHFAYFHFLEFASLHRSPSMIIGARNFSRRIESYSPDLILSTHAHLNHGFFELSRLSYHKPSRFVVYCGELGDGNGFSRHWINPRNDLFVCPYEEGGYGAQKRGMPVNKILVGGPLLRKPFYANHHKFKRPKVISDYGLDSNKPIFLLGTGANGVNNHIPIIKAINQAKINCQILALCGRNEKTFMEIKKLGLSCHTKVVPFMHVSAHTMVDLLKLSNWMLARPGAGLTTEAIVTGCPLIFDLSGGCMPQETNNLNFWKSRAGSFLSASSPSQLIHHILSNVQVPRLNMPLEQTPLLLLSALCALGESQ